jgi:hypothetical protein
MHALGKGCLNPAECRSWKTFDYATSTNGEGEGAADGEEVKVMEAEATTYILAAPASIRQRKKRIVGRNMRLMLEDAGELIDERTISLMMSLQRPGSEKER